jgi:cellulose 1,4-beta-cellobiosidase
MYSVLSKYASKVEIVLIIEPDSLPNLVTNNGDYHCGNSATTKAYETGVTYAVNKLSSLPVTIYIDAAHGGWLGWEVRNGFKLF